VTATAMNNVKRHQLVSRVAGAAVAP
jgi:hypothetical protein